ncbi:MAG: hypothetical protein J6A01_08760, partial [Proteobacteria bacterium]|nr:hypothetical protein [Pseudomonadota bacterium]
MNKKYIILLALLTSFISIEGCDNSSEFTGYYAERRDTCLDSIAEGIKVEYDGQKDSCICTFDDMKVECLNGTVCDAEIKGCRKCKSKDNYCKEGIKHICEHGEWLQIECPFRECLDGLECTSDYSKCLDNKTLVEYQKDEQVDSVNCQGDEEHEGKCENAKCVCYYYDRCGSETLYPGMLWTCNPSGLLAPTECPDGMTCPVGQTACVPIDSSVKCIENSVICDGNNKLKRCIDGQYIDDPNGVCEKGCVSIEGNVKCRQCTEDEINCVDDTHYRECTGIGEWSEETEQCSDGKVCDSELKQCAMPSDSCTEESIYCDGNTLIAMCNDQPTRTIQCPDGCDETNKKCICNFSDRCGSETQYPGMLLTCNPSGLLAPTDCPEGMTCPVGQTECVPIDPSVKCIENSVICTDNHEMKRCIDGQYIDDPNDVCEKGCVSIEGNVKCRQCTEDEIYCEDDTHYRECTDIGEWSETTFDCPENQYCDTNENKCMPMGDTELCSDDFEPYCNNNILIYCNKNQKAEITCTNGCDNAKCTCSDACPDNCNEHGECGIIDECAGKNCVNGCSNGVCTCSEECPDNCDEQGKCIEQPVCQDSEIKCENTDDIGVLSKCDHGQWLDGGNCGTVSCNENLNDCGECQNSATRCSDKENIGYVKTCQNGKWSEDLASCENVSCNEDQTDCGTCKNTSTKCENDASTNKGQSTTCTNGTLQTKTCDNDYSCKDDTTCGDCLNGTYHCHDTSNIARCDNGTWVTSKLISCDNDLCTSGEPVGANGE